MISPEQFQPHEQRVVEAARSAGWHVDRFDTARFDQTTIDNIHRRGIENNIRHLPDLILTRPDAQPWLVECKSVSPKHRDSPNFSIEIASWWACDTLSTSFHQLLIVWHDLTATNPRDMRRLNLERGKRYGNGSDDHYWLINRRELGKISRPFVDYLTGAPQ